jgi:hypothetical protein
MTVLKMKGRHGAKGRRAQKALSLSSPHRRRGAGDSTRDIGSITSSRQRESDTLAVPPNPPHSISKPKRSRQRHNTRLPCPLARSQDYCTTPHSHCCSRGGCSLVSGHQAAEASNTNEVQPSFAPAWDHRASTAPGTQMPGDPLTKVDASGQHGV